MPKEVLTEPVIISIVTSVTSIVVMLIKHRVTRDAMVELERKLNDCIKTKSVLVDLLIEHSLISKEKGEEFKWKLEHPRVAQ